MNCMLKTHILALRLLTTFGLLSLSMIVLSGCGKSETANNRISSIARSQYR